MENELFASAWRMFVILGTLSMIIFYALWQFYIRKKKAGRLDPNQSFLKNLWDAVLP
jgi:hypothetical protein